MKKRHHRPPPGALCSIRRLNRLLRQTRKGDVIIYAVWRGPNPRFRSITLDKMSYIKGAVLFIDHDSPWSSGGNIHLVGYNVIPGSRTYHTKSYLFENVITALAYKIKLESDAEQGDDDEIY